MRGKTLTTVLSFLLSTAPVLGVVLILTLVVYAHITVPGKVEFGGILINEEKTRTLFIVNSTVTDPIIINSICDKPNSFTAILTTPVGSTFAQFDFKPNGTSTMTPNITAGKVQMKVRGITQSPVNCTLDYIVSNTTNVTWVPSVE